MGGLGGLVLLTTPGVPGVAASAPVATNSTVRGEEDNNILLAQSLKGLLPTKTVSLTPEEEEKITALLSQKLNLEVSVRLSGIRLNKSYGLIGGEQHLYRYPGDNLYQHFNSATDWAMYGSAGIAPHLGAWGYFAPSKDQFTQEDSQREKYYLAVQTFLAPGFAENVDKYRDFFKFRKMLVVNPLSGQAVVAVVGDAGPAQWTGKDLGGSPEVMQALGLASGPRKGAVLYFFIDDPSNIAPLGPVKI